MEDDKFIMVYGWMMNKLGLSGDKLLVYALIYGFARNGLSMPANSREYIASNLDMEQATVDTALEELCSQGLIKKASEVRGREPQTTERGAATMYKFIKYCCPVKFFG